MSDKLILDDQHTTWSKFFYYLFRRRAAVLFLFCLSGLIFLLLTFRVQLKANILDLLPSRDPIVANYRLIQTSFKQLDLMLIDIGPQDNRKPPSEIELMAVADSLTRSLSSSKLFRQIDGQISFDQIDETLHVLSRHKSNLFTAQDQKTLEKKLTLPAIRDSIVNWKKQLIETPAPYLGQMFSRDPLNIDQMLIEKLNFIGISANRLKVRNGWMFTSNLQHILILCEPRYAADDEIRTGNLITFMNATIQRAEATANNHDVRIAYIANHRFAQINAALLRSDIARTMTFSLLCISIIVILVFRRPVLFGVFTLLPAIFGGLFATGFMVLLFKHFSAISIGCGAMLMGIVVDFSLHILYHLDQNETFTREVIVRTLSELATPLLITAGTTLIAFMALMLSVLPGYTEIGIFSSLGIVGSLLFSIVGLPLLIPQLKPRKKPILTVTKIYLPFFLWSQKHRRTILLSLCLMTAITGVGLTRLKFDGDVRNLNASTPEIDRDVSRIIDTYGDPTMVTSVVVSGSNGEEALKRNDLLFQQLMALQKQNYIQSVSSIAPLLPSSKAQRTNLERWKTFWNEERIGRLKNDIGKVAAELRLDPARSLDFLRTIPGDESLMTFKDLNTGWLARALATRVGSSQKGFMLLSSFQRTNAGSTKPITALLESSVPGVATANGQSLVRRMVQLVKQEMKKLGSITLLFVIIAMISYAKRPGQFVRLISPLLISLFWTFGIMGWFGIKLNIVNDMVVVFVFGLVDDYCLFLHTAWKKFQEGLPEFLTHTSGAITISAATTILGALALTLAKHPALHSMGITALLGISMGLVASFLIIPHSESGL